jgi:hypothetical protein
MELHLHYLIRLHGVVLSKTPETTLLLQIHSAEETFYLSQNICEAHSDIVLVNNIFDNKIYSVSTKSHRSFEKLWRANKLS